MNTQAPSVSVLDEVCALTVLLGEDAAANYEKHIKTSRSLSHSLLRQLDVSSPAQ